MFHLPNHPPIRAEGLLVTIHPEMEPLIERMNIINFAIDRFSEFLELQTQEMNSGERITESLLADLRRFWKSIQKELPHKRK